MRTRLTTTGTMRGRVLPALAAMLALLVLGAPAGATGPGTPGGPEEAAGRPATARAGLPGSLVFIRGHNVWLSRGDGSGQYQVTRDGTADQPYISPSQSDTGIIAVGFGRHIVRMRQNGTVLNRIDPAPLQSSVSHPLDGPPLDVAISPNGALVAYTFAAYQCPPGAECGYRTATGITRSDRFTPAGQYGASYFQAPSWIGNGRTLQSGGFLHHINLHDLGGQPVHWFDDKDVAASSTDLGDAELSPDGAWLAAVRGYDSTTHITWYAVRGDARSGPPPAPPSWECLTSQSAGLADPTWAPDSSTIAWEEPDGIWVTTDLAGCGNPRLMIRNAGQPDWSSAPAAPGVRELTVGSRPRVTGTPKVGRRLTARPGSWSPRPARFTYQWLRSGRSVRGATRAAYRLTRADRGERMSVRVTGLAPGYARRSVLSSSTARVRG